ncbi:MAG: N-acetylmuramoyl-L-alanine amidase [Proteobacteria bacterium]|nr:N-acetylmuramoyl-L-alanine amidase [Pseudomonadota bacterium]
MAGTDTIRAELTEAQKKEIIRKQHAGGSSHSSGKKKSASGKVSGSSAKKKSSSVSSGGKHSSGTNKKKHAGSSSGHYGSTAAPSHPSATPPPSPDHQTVSVTAPIASPIPPSPNPVAPAAALPLPHGAEPSAPITIEKSGVEPDRGLEPVPAPEQAHEGFWSRVFGSHKTYAYLSSSVRSAIDRAPVKRGRWKYIVVHNSGTREGNARVFDVYHRRVRHMENGLAYHFVIGDGHGSGDGQIEVGPRWTRQINGGHVASDYLNDIALGICLVGDFNRDSPTKAQVAALEELVAYLRNRVGRSQGHQAIVHAHKEINPRPTDCPGDHFPYGWLHAKFGNARTHP